MAQCAAHRFTTSSLGVQQRRACGLRYPQQVPLAGLPARPRGSKASYSSGQQERYPQPDTYQLWPTQLRVSKVLYNGAELGYLLFELMLIDAAFSGDWSRIEVLTKGQELLLQEVVKFIAVAHSVTGAISVRLALDSGYNAVEAGLKGLLLGTLGIYEVHQRCQGNSVSGGK